MVFLPQGHSSRGGGCQTFCLPFLQIRKKYKRFYYSITHGLMSASHGIQHPKVVLNLHTLHDPDSISMVTWLRVRI